MKVEQLKPCPFCGGEAEIKNDHDIFTDAYTACIRCKECGSQTREIDITVCSNESYSERNISPLGYLARVWNTRKEE